jgi:hypothetical protein
VKGATRLCIFNRLEPQLDAAVLDDARSYRPIVPEYGTSRNADHFVALRFYEILSLPVEGDSPVVDLAVDFDDDLGF